MMDDVWCRVCEFSKQKGESSGRFGGLEGLGKWLCVCVYVLRDANVNAVESRGLDAA